MSATDDKPLNKSQFVRSFPETIPAAELVKAAAEKGINLSRLYVNSVRFEMRKQASKGKTGSSMPTTPAGNPPSAMPAVAQPARETRMPAPRSFGHDARIREAIERMVEQKVEELLKRRVGDIVGG